MMIDGAGLMTDNALPFFFWHIRRMLSIIDDYYLKTFKFGIILPVLAFPRPPSCA